MTITPFYGYPYRHRIDTVLSPKNDGLGLRAVPYITALWLYRTGPVTVPLKTFVHPQTAVHNTAVGRISP